MNYLSKRFISVLLSFTFFAMAIVVHVNFIKPTYEVIKADQGRLASSQQKTQEYKEVFGKLKEILAAFKQSPDLQNRISMAFPLEANTADSMNQITAIAAANGLVVSSVDISAAPVIPAAAGKAAAATSLIKSVGVLKNTVKVSGTYAQVRSFVQGVESSVRISGIKSFKLDRAANTSADQLTALFEIETYYQLN